MPEAIAVNRTPQDPFSFEDPLFGGVDTVRRVEDLPVGGEDDWVDPGFTAAHKTRSNSRFLDDLTSLAGEVDSDELADARAILDREATAIAPVSAPAPVIVAAPVVAPVVVDEPEVIEYEDGSSVSIEKTAKGWTATLNSNDGSGIERFHGHNKNDMWKNLAAGKLNANKKIRSLTRQIKLGTSPENGQPAPAAPAPVPARQLSADEVFEIKTQLTNNPDLAMEKWFQKRAGMTLEQLISLAQKGGEADENLRQEREARAFAADYPEYYPTDNNFNDLVNYLRKHKNLNNDVKQFNATNLGIAFEALSTDGLLETEQEEVVQVPQPAVVVPATPVVATPAPAPEPTPAAPPVPPPVFDPRIVGRRTGPRAGFGIPASTATADTTVSDQPLPDEELDDLSNEAISELFNGVRKLRARQSPRR